MEKVVTKKKRKSFKTIMAHNWQLYLFILLPMIYIFVFNYIPMWGAQIAFRDFTAVGGITGSQWVGMKHFVRFFESPIIWTIVGNTVKLSVYGLIAGMPFPVILAILIKYAPYKKLGKFTQSITYAPHFISTVVMVGIISEVLTPRNGMLSNLLGVFGVGYTANLMGSAEAFSSVYVWSGIWQGMGFAAIVYTAILTSVDQSLHEAAMVDGASVLRRIWHIDLPSLRPQIVLMLILSLGNILSVGFEKALLMQNSMNLASSEIISTYVYKMGIASTLPDFSYTTAIGLTQSVISFILVISVNKIAKKVGEISLW